MVFLAFVIQMFIFVVLYAKNISFTATVQQKCIFWSQTSIKPYGFWCLFHPKLHFCCTVQWKWTCCVEKHMKPYGFVGFRIPNLYFCCAVSKKHKVQGLITDWSWSAPPSLTNPSRKATQRLDYRLELFWSIFLYKSFMKRPDYRLELLWSILLYKSFTKGLITDSTIQWAGKIIYPNLHIQSSGTLFA